MNTTAALKWAITTAEAHRLPDVAEALRTVAADLNASTEVLDGIERDLRAMTEDREPLLPLDAGREELHVEEERDSWRTPGDTDEPRDEVRGEQ